MNENKRRFRDINIILDRKTAKARMVTLFQDQEDRLSEMNDKYNVSLKISTLLREGFDTLLDDVEEELKKYNKKD